MLLLILLCSVSRAWPISVVVMWVRIPVAKTVDSSFSWWCGVHSWQDTRALLRASSLRHSPWPCAHRELDHKLLLNPYVIEMLYNSLPLSLKSIPVSRPDGVVYILNSIELCRADPLWESSSQHTPWPRAHHGLSRKLLLKCYVIEMLDNSLPVRLKYALKCSVVENCRFHFPTGGVHF